MLKEQDFIWKEHMTNNIPSNPLEEYYCLVDTGSCIRKYSIQPQYPEIRNGYVDHSKEPELYIFFEATGRKATDEEKKSMFYEYTNYDGCVFDHKTFIRAYISMIEAKQRAYFNYKAIYGYALSHIVDNVEDSTKDHVFI